MIVEKRYEVSLTTLEPFRIGGTSDPLSGADNPVAVVGGKVVVPGPSLKGALRSEVESYLIDKYYDKAAGKWLSDKRNFQPCIPGAKLSRDEENLVRDGKYIGDACHYPCTPRKCGNTKHNICPVCYLFGSMGLNGFVRTPFLYSESSIGELYSARMDRARGTVVEGTNRPYQLIPDNSTFKGFLEVTIKDDILKWVLGQKRPLVENTEGDTWLQSPEWTQEKILTELIINRLKNVSLLGGYKSKGFGKVKIDVKEAK